MPDPKVTVVFSRRGHTGKPTFYRVVNNVHYPIAFLQRAPNADRDVYESLADVVLALIPDAKPQTL